MSYAYIYPDDVITDALLVQTAKQSCELLLKVREVCRIAKL